MAGDDSVRKTSTPNPAPDSDATPDSETALPETRTVTVRRGPDTTPQLSALAQQIQRSHREVILGVKRTLEHARLAGELLLRAKDVVGHGNWLEWLREIQFNKRTAEDYTRIAREWHHLRPHVDDLHSIAAALRALRRPQVAVARSRLRKAIASAPPVASEPVAQKDTQSTAHSTPAPVDHVEAELPTATVELDASSATSETEATPPPEAAAEMPDVVDNRRLVEFRFAGRVVIDRRRTSLTGKSRAEFAGAIRAAIERAFASEYRLVDVTVGSQPH